MVHLSPNFVLSEFTPRGWRDEDTPLEVVARIARLCLHILQPERDASGIATVVTSGWRPGGANVTAGGVARSDHKDGSAADFYKLAGGGRTWQQNTRAAYEWTALHKNGEFGQLIYEDHRTALGKPGKLWVHVALPTLKHQGGEDDPNRLLVSFAPGQFERYTDEMEHGA